MEIVHIGPMVCPYGSWKTNVPPFPGYQRRSPLVLVLIVRSGKLLRLRGSLIYGRIHVKYMEKTLDLHHEVIRRKGAAVFFKNLHKCLTHNRWCASNCHLINSSDGRGMLAYLEYRAVRYYTTIATDHT
jgi:hypothetical protein